MARLAGLKDPLCIASQVVSLVRAAGGIPIAKTNISQAMFFYECTNPVYGRTVNPHNKSYSCGGSSGGEGALLAMDGAALGWGSDIGGSLRSVASASHESYMHRYSTRHRICPESLRQPVESTL